ncbi:MAG: cadmium-translocating P-type ATPase [Ignavibacteria bacterium]|nr:cadmium-translocating P-type ATPase [Ignavibacteria bacterium]
MSEIIEKTIPVELNIEGMDCPSCAMKIERRLNKLGGVSNARVDLANEIATFEITGGTLDIDSIKKEIDKLGYKAVEPDIDIEGTDEEKLAEDEKQKAKSIFRLKIITSIALSVVIVILGMKEHIGILSGLSQTTANWISFPLSAIVVFWCGMKFIKGFLADIRALSAGMDSLIAIGTLSAFFYSIVVMIYPEISGEHEHTVYFESAAMIISFILLGNYLEFNLKNKTHYAIRSLMDLQVKNALVIRNGMEFELPVKKVRVGDIILVKPGEHIPVDGVVIEGSSSVDEAMMTGESMPSDKVPGTQAIGGTINVNGYLKIRVERTVNDSFLTKIINMVKDAQGSKPRIQRIADKVSAVFVPIVILIAIVTFLIWNFYAGQTLSYSLLKAVAVLIIACPCALGLATPIAIVLGVGKAAENKILFNNAEAIENVSKIDTIVFDKTGTLTYAKFEVKEIFSDNSNFSKEELLKLTASIENFSEHPIAKAIVEKYRSDSVGSDKMYEVNEFKNTSGIGVEASMNGKSYKVGGVNLINKDNLNTSGSEKGFKNIYLFENDALIGEIKLADKIKDNAKEILGKLRSSGYRLSLISGDNSETTEKIAAELGIDDYRAEVLPDQKLDIISELQRSGRKPAMVGDGINDAPALSKSDLGIAIGTGQDIAIQSADVILVKGDLENILALFKISNKTIRIIKQNIFWAFFYNAAAIPVAAGILVPIGISVSPVMASMLMAMSDVVTVLINSMRIKYMKIQ